MKALSKALAGYFKPARAYRGKYPHRIAQVSTGDQGRTVVLVSNGGMRLVCDARLACAQTGKLPQLRQDIRDYLFAEVKS